MRRASIGLALLLSLAGCGADPADRVGSVGTTDPSTEPRSGAAEAPAEIDGTPWRFVERGDLPALRDRGGIRFLGFRRPELDHLPREGDPRREDVALAQEFARVQGLEAILIPVSSTEEMLEYLVSGRGDVALGHRALPSDLRDRIELTVPFARLRALVVGRAEEARVDSEAALAGREILVPAVTAFPAASARLEAAGLKIRRVGGDGGPLDLVEEVASGRADLALLGDRWLEQASTYQTNVKALLELPDRTALTASVRKNATSLRRELDRFLVDHALGERATDERTLTVLTENRPSVYELRRGRLAGFDYELVERFAEESDRRIRIRVAPSREVLLSWIRDGQGDVVASQLPDEVDLGPAIRTRLVLDGPVVVVAAGSVGEVAVEELSSHSLAVPADRWRWGRILRLEGKGGVVPLLASPIPGDELARRVLADPRELLVVPRPEAPDVLATHPELRPVADVERAVPLYWAVRPGADELAADLNAFLQREYRGTIYNILRRRYYAAQAREAAAPAALRDDGTFSPWDDLVRRLAEKARIDWRLVLAQIYQESRFDPEARSGAGAVGLLQVLPSTARELGITDLTDPESGLEAGIRYLLWTRERFDADLPGPERMAFALAAYNAGVGHVRDARRLARERGLDPDRWFGSVEDTMLLLSDPAIARTVRHGYCRGREPVRYVREILERYRAYVQLDPTHSDPA